MSSSKEVKIWLVVLGVLIAGFVGATFWRYSGGGRETARGVGRKNPPEKTTTTARPTVLKASAEHVPAPDHAQEHASHDARQAAWTQSQPTHRRTAKPAIEPDEPQAAYMPREATVVNESQPDDPEYDEQQYDDPRQPARFEPSNSVRLVPASKTGNPSPIKQVAGESALANDDPFLKSAAKPGDTIAQAPKSDVPSKPAPSSQSAWPPRNSDPLPTTGQGSWPTTSQPAPAADTVRPAPQTFRPSADPAAVRPAPIDDNPAPAAKGGSSSYTNTTPRSPVRVVPRSGKYQVEPNDNYWTVSEKVYGTGAYFKAIHEHNRRTHPRPTKLQVGDTLLTPDVAVLREKYADLCPKERKPVMNLPQNTMVSTRVRGQGRMYTVQEGDTLFEVARTELGKASRWKDIFDANRQELGEDFDYLKPGTQLWLPTDDARPDNVTGRPGQTIR